jgi:eukaryotic-like serine/threonine-protein kinase
MAADVDRARSIFLAAIEEDPQERPAFLDGACGDDGELRARVEHLLGAHQALGSIHFHPIPGPAADAGERFSEGPGSVIGPYTLLEAIGEGGMGTVYMAEQEWPVRRRVALKIIKPGMDSAQVIARFEAERQALALMDHPHIAKVLEAGTMGSGRPFFVMELVKGIPITRFCDEHRLTLRERLELFVPVCQAVQHAHQKGIIHRDLKPSNVLVALHDDKPLPQVIDFGVAKATRDRLTERTTVTGFGVVVGTLEYMSPEQATLNAVDVDTRSDIYALGILLYELLTGTTPFDRSRRGQASFDELLRIIREEEPPRPSARLGGSGEALAALSAQRRADPAKLPGLVRGELDWIVMKALEKDRARRYETANGLARDLQRYLADEPVEAGPSSAGYRLRKLARRYRNALATAAAFVLLLALAAAVSTWQAVRATRAERAERGERDRAVAAEKRAKAEQSNARAALDFLWKDVLSQASYRNEPDRDLTVRTLLDRVADRLGRGPGRPPLVEAAVRQMVGGLYIDQGEYRKAQPHLEAALEVQRRELGEEDPQTLATMHQLGHCLYRRDRREATGVLAHTLELRRRVLGDDHDDTLFTARFAAACYALEGRLEEAERLLRRTLEARRRVFGDQHSESLVTMYWLAGHLSRRGQLEEAESLATRCAEHARQRAADYPAVALAALNTLVGVYIAREDPAPAEPLAIHVVEGMRRHFGRQHPFTLKAINRLIRVYQLQGRHAQAVPLLAESLATARKVHEDDHPVVFGILHLLGRSLLEEKKYAEAERHLRECLQGLERERSGRLTRDGSPVFVQGLLGESLLGQRRYAEAEPILLASYEGLREAPDAGDPEAIPARERLGIVGLERIVRLYDAWGQPGRAEAWRKVLAAQAGSAAEGRPDRLGLHGGAHDR